MPSYSKTPLLKKLGIKEKFSVLPINAQKDYRELFSEWPGSISPVNSGNIESIDFIHIFCLSTAELIENTEQFKPLLKKSGILWISWPKRILQYCYL